MASATDNFDRADGGVGANWDNLNQSLIIVSNRCEGNAAGNNLARWVADTFDADQSAQVTLGVDADGGGPCVRLTVGVAGSGYLAYTAATTFVEYYRITDGSYAKLGATIGSLTNLAVGHTLKLAIAGTTLTATWNGAAQATRTDATWATGAAGLHVFGTTAAWDDWIGDPITTATVTFFGSEFSDEIRLLRPRAIIIPYDM